MKSENESKLLTVPVDADAEGALEVLLKLRTGLLIKAVTGAINEAITTDREPGKEE